MIGQRDHSYRARPQFFHLDSRTRVFTVTPSYLSTPIRGNLKGFTRSNKSPFSIYSVFTRSNQSTFFDLRYFYRAMTLSLCRFTGLLRDPINFSCSHSLLPVQANYSIFTLFTWLRKLHTVYPLFTRKRYSNCKNMYHTLHDFTCSSNHHWKKVIFYNIFTCCGKL